jgi:gas vesicle protein
MPVEPGHDVFAGDKAADKAKSISSERVVEPLPKEAVVVPSVGADVKVEEAEKKEEVPLPPHQGAGSTGKKKVVEDVHAKEALAKEKVPEGVQEKIAQVKEQVKENVVEKVADIHDKVAGIHDQVADAKEKLKDHAKAQSEEERVRMELYGEEKKA